MKKLFRLTLVALAALLLGACSGNEEDKRPTEPMTLSFTLSETPFDALPEAEEPVRVTLWLVSTDDIREVKYHYSTVVSLREIAALTLPTDVPEGNYNLYAWIDGFGVEEGERYYFNVENYRNIALDVNRYSELDIVKRNAFYATKSDVALSSGCNVALEALSPYGGYTLTMKHPAQLLGVTGSGLKLRLRSWSPVAAAYDLIFAKPSNSVSSLSLPERELEEITDSTEEIFIAQDILLGAAGETTSARLIVEILDTAGEIIFSQSATIETDCGTVKDVAMWPAPAARNHQ